MKNVLLDYLGTPVTVSVQSNSRKKTENKVHKKLTI